MSMEIAKPTARISSGFRRIVDVFLAGEGLPFSRILAAERIERICGQHGCLFGRHGIFSTPVVLWAFLSLATGAITNLACGPYQGKETGETALLRSMLDSFQPGDVVVMDRSFCSFMMLAMLHGRGVHACTRQHQRCKTPKMVEAEEWATILASNLIRTTAAGAAALHGKQPRQISFTAACQ